MALWPQTFLISFTAQFVAGISRGLTQVGTMSAATSKPTTKTRKF